MRFFFLHSSFPSSLSHIRFLLWSTLLATFVIFANGQSNLQSGLVAWYPFDGNASDMSGNGNHGTVNGATLGTDRHGQTDKAYSFDGVDDNIIFSEINSLEAQSHTLSTWVNAKFWSKDIISKDGWRQPKDNGCFARFLEMVR